VAYQHSRDAVVKIDNAAGSLVEITSYMRAANLSREPEQLDTTVFGELDRSFLPGFVGASFPISGLLDFADDAIFDILATAVGSATTRSFEYGPEGGTSGKVKYSGEVIVLDFGISARIDEPESWTATCRVSGAVTRGAFA